MCTPQRPRNNEDFSVVWCGRPGLSGEVDHIAPAPKANEWEAAARGQTA